MKKPKKDLSMCAGCYHEEYHYGFMNLKECWSFKGGKIIKRLPVPVHQRPPYNKENAKYFLSCYKKKGMVYVSPDVITKEGYWK